LRPQLSLLVLLFVIPQGSASVFAVAVVVVGFTLSFRAQRRIPHFALPSLVFALAAALTSKPRPNTPWPPYSPALLPQRHSQSLPAHLSHAASYLPHACVRGTHRRTFLQYSSYSAPNNFRSSAPHTTTQTRPRTARSQTPPRLRPCSPARRSPTARPIPPGIPGTSGSAHIDRTPPQPASSAEQSALAFRVPSIRNPICSEAPPRNLIPRAHLQSSAIAPRPLCRREKPSQDGNNQNQSARNAAPTVSEATAAGQCSPPSAPRAVPACLIAMTASTTQNMRK
jgi:hypothetical protein